MPNDATPPVGAPRAASARVGAPGAVVAAFLVTCVTALGTALRRRRWARWPLTALCLVAAVSGVTLGYYVAPLVVTTAAVAVLVLLFLPSSRAWLRREHDSVASQSPAD